MAPHVGARAVDVREAVGRSELARGQRSLVPACAVRIGGQRCPPKIGAWRADSTFTRLRADLETKRASVFKIAAARIQFADVLVTVDLDVDGAADVSATLVFDVVHGGRAALLDVLMARRLIEQPRYERGIELLKGVVAMLTTMTTVESST